MAQKVRNARHFRPLTGNFGQVDGFSWEEFRNFDVSLVVGGTHYWMRNEMVVIATERWLTKSRMLTLAFFQPVIGVELITSSTSLLSWLIPFLLRSRLMTGRARSVRPLVSSHLGDSSTMLEAEDSVQCTALVSAVAKRFRGTIF